MTFNNKIFLMGMPAIVLGLVLFFGASVSAQMEAPVDNLSASTVAESSPMAAEPSGRAGSPTAAAVEGPGAVQTWNWHMQSTAILQGYSSLAARYSGSNSLPPSGEARETVSVDTYGGYRLWNGAEAHIDLLTWQGFGLRGTVGIDDFPNGEAYKVGTHKPHFDLARFYIRQTIGLGGGRENILDDQQTLGGQQDVSRLTFTIGRFSAKDVFDTNTYANDPRKQFMNWALVANIAWDYPADSLGYTTGVTVELNQPKWTLRYGFFQLPNQRNGFTAEGQFLVIPGESTAGDGSFLRSWGMVVEQERRYGVKDHPGTVRLLAYVNQGRFGSYRAALSAPGTDIDLTHAYRHEYGFGLNAEQEITKNVGVFSRLGWNDGHSEAWMFADANYTASLGASVKGAAWRRPEDTVGLAGVWSGISRNNRLFLQAGGTGILDGDGALSYSAEKVMEMYYDCKIAKHLHGALDYQFVANPAFNNARGPVSVFGTRLHWEF